MTRLSHSEMIAKAGFEPGEFNQSRNLRAAVCNGTATSDQLAEYSQYAHKWDEFSRLTIERDQADQLERQAPDPARHSGDTSLGAALADLRSGQAGRAPVVIRPQMVRVDVSGGNGGMQDIPAPEQWPMYRGSSSSTGHEKIAAAFAGKKR